MMNETRKIAVPDYYGEGEHIYEDQLGWTLTDRKEARSNVSGEIFEAMIKMGRNLAFYYVDNDTFYEIFGELNEVEFVKLPRDMTKKYIGWQCPRASHWPDECELIRRFEKDADVWGGIFVDGKPLEAVLARSYIFEND